MSAETAQAIRLPSVDAVLRDAAVEDLLSVYGREGVTDAVRTALVSARQAGRSANAADIAAEASVTLADLMQPSLRPVFNLTGTVLHTNLGRAPMPEEAIRAMASAAGAANVEFDLDTGGRGERDSHVERWLTRLTGAEAALVVNNNAAA
ncbi:MAG: hypothetical protein MI861_09350, partial [Pirellulales bacterium]|nr:hypothetical protein [Pirellulales bacterium]